MCLSISICFFYHAELGYELSCLNTTSLSFDEIYLRHYRLGNCAALFDDKNPSFFQCDICVLAKMHKDTYPTPYKPSKPFALILTFGVLLGSLVVMVIGGL